jgi:hypothetical protein
MSNDSPVKGFRKLGGEKPQQPKPEESQSRPQSADNISPAPWQPAKPADDSFAQNVGGQPSEAMPPPPWQSSPPPPPGGFSPAQPPGESQMPGPPAAPPWQSSPPPAASSYPAQPAPSWSPQQPDPFASPQPDPASFAPQQPPGVSQVPNPPSAPPWQQSAQPYPQQGYPQYPPGHTYAPQRTGPSPDTAFLLNLIFGLLGLFGIGTMYAGKTGEGATLLIGGMMVNLVISALVAVTAGFCAFIVYPFYIIFAVSSANSIKKYLQQQYQQHP